MSSEGWPRGQVRCGAWARVGLLAVWLGAPCLAPVASATDRSAQELATQRIVGKAYYENDDYKAAETAFRRCLELAPESAADHFNLALVLMRANRFDESLALLDRAEPLDPALLAPVYLRGIIHKRRAEFDQAIKHLQRVVTRDPACVGAWYNLGLCLKQTERYDEAIAAFKSAIEVSPNHASAHYQLVTLYRLTGDVETSQRHVEIYRRLEDTLEESEKTAEALERSAYSEIIEVPLPASAAVKADRRAVRFVDVTEKAGLSLGRDPVPVPPMGRTIERSAYGADELMKRYVPSVGGAVALGDYDSDGDLDLYLVHCTADPETSANRLYRNDGKGRFEDVTAPAGVGDAHMGTDAAFGDYDNDGHLDLYVVNAGANVLYRNRGDGTFEDVTVKSRTGEPQFGRRALFVDYDHDYDLDILVANDVELGALPDKEKLTLPDDLGGQVNTLLRNNGDGTFTDQTDEANLLVDCSQTRGLVMADFDEDQDIDLFTLNADHASLLFTNARLGRFDLGGSFSPALEAGARAAVEADLDRDGHPDLIVAADKGFLRYRNNGTARFTGEPVALPDGLSAIDEVAVFDHDNDGLSDLIMTSHQARGLTLLAGSADGSFEDRTSATGLDTTDVAVADFAVGDLDNDGDQDIVLLTRDAGPKLLRNDGGSGGNWMSVRLVGKKVNRGGYGAAVEVAAPGHYQRQTLTRAPLHFGLGGLDHIDVVRVTWPNGVAQNVIQPRINVALEIEEQVKVSASCAMLYADGGTGFKLVNEVLGVGPLGVPISPGVYHQPDCTELTKIEPDQLAARDGRYELRLVEELRETTYADRMTLRVIDHPPEVDIIPNEMFKAPPFPEDRFFAVADPRPPRAAFASWHGLPGRGSRAGCPCHVGGRDVLDLVLRRDDRFPTFPLTDYPGLAKTHSLTLDLSDPGGPEPGMLFLDGWIHWPESSTVMAIAQDPRHAIAPLALQVRDAAGAWQTVIESVGLPTSKGLIVPVDLTRVFLSEDRQVRLVTNLCVYFDRIFVAASDHAARCRVTELPVDRADLRYRGFSRMERDALGRERFDYADVSPTGSWSPPRGMLTRYGDVTPLLARPDDMYVIFGPGDELAMTFDATRLAAPPAGWVRSFIFYANGWVKDGDLNTTRSQTVGPLPFHGMSGYPYAATEHYPDTPLHRAYLRTYNTRLSRPTVGSLVTAD